MLSSAVVNTISQQLDLLKTEPITTNHIPHGTLPLPDQVTKESEERMVIVFSFVSKSEPTRL